MKLVESFSENLFAKIFEYHLALTSSPESFTKLLFTNIYREFAYKNQFKLILKVPKLTSVV